MRQNLYSISNSSKNERRRSGGEDIAIFIQKVIGVRKIMNVKGLRADKRHKDPLEKVIEDSDDYRLDLIANFGEMALKMSTAS